MGGLRMTRNDLAAYEMLSRAGSDIKGGMMQYGLSRAADVKPETVSDTALTETTAGTDGMVYDSDTGQYLPQYMGGGQPTGMARAQMNTPADGASKAPDGVLPTFNAKTTTKYRMGDLMQAEPFSEDQIASKVARDRAKIRGNFGDFKGEEEMVGMSKKYDDSHAKAVVNRAGKEALKGLEKEHPSIQAQAVNMAKANKLAELGRSDEAMTHFIQAQALSDSVYSNLKDDADRRRAVGDWSGVEKLIDFGLADGKKSKITPNQDGSIVFRYGDKDKLIPADKIEDQLLMLGDSKARREYAAAQMKQRMGVAEKQAEADIKDKSESGRADVAFKKAAAESHTANAEFTRGVKADAARAKAAGGGSTVPQQRFDMQQASAFKKSVAPLISFENPVTMKMELNKHGDQLANMMIESGQFTPSEIRNKLYSISSAAKTPDEFNKVAIEQMAKLNAALKASSAPAESAPRQAGQPAQKSTAQPAAGMAKQPAPTATGFAEPAQAPAQQQPRLIRRGQPYTRAISIPDGKGGWIQAPQEVEDVIDPGTGEVVTRPVAQQLPRSMSFGMR